MQQFTKHLLRFLVILLCTTQYTSAQNTIALSLNEAIQLASNQSFESFKAKNLLTIRYNTFLNSKNYHLPELSLNLTPMKYHNGLEQVYVDGEKEYRQLENITSRGSLNLTQRIKSLGGSLRLYSTFNRYQSYGEDQASTLNYITTPFNVSYSQSLFTPNTYKWKEKLDPIQYEKAISEFIEDQQDVALLAIRHYFQLLRQQSNVNVAYNAMVNDSTLYRMGKSRLKIASITLDELLKLELRVLASTAKYKQAVLSEQDKQRRFKQILELGASTQIECALPAHLPELVLNPEVIWHWTKINSPQIIYAEYQKLSTELDLKKAKTDRYKLNMDVDFGLNDKDNYWPKAYQDSRYAGNAEVSINMPLIDWGENKRNIQNKKLKIEEIEWQNKRLQHDIKNNVINEVALFNAKKELIENAAKREEVANIVNEMVKERFVLGKVNVIHLNNAQSEKEAAISSYISTIHAYWESYYSIRKLCLYDFENDVDLRQSINQNIKTLTK